MYLNNFNLRTRLEPAVVSVLEHHFEYRKSPSSPSVEEITFLAESLQLDKKVVKNWFRNRKQKEKRKMLFSHETIPQMPPGKTAGNIRSSEILSRQFERLIRNRNLMDLYNSPLNLSSNGSISRNVKRFSLGKPNGAITQQRRTVLVLGTGGQIHQKFVNQIINYIVNVEKEENLRFLVEEETGQSNCISVYDIHHANGFRIPFSLTIVVTPYSGDWEEEFFRDQKVAEMFREFIEAKDGIQELDMICNVTVETGEIKQPFLSIFGKDVEKNINNWKLSVDFLSDKGSWQAVVHHFFTVLATMETAPLLLTKLVLYERKRMEEVVDRLQLLMAAGLSKMEEMKIAKQTIAYCDYQLKTEQELFLNYLSSTASVNGDCNCSEHHCRMYPDNHSGNYVTSGRELYIKQEPSSSRCDNQNHCDHQSFYSDEAKWKDIRSNGQQLVKTLQKDLLKNGNSIRHHLNCIWRCIHQFNKFALHGNSFSNEKVFELLLDAGQHLKKLNF